MVTAVLSVQMVGLVARWWCKYPVNREEGVSVS
jgi:hypothetical protein